MELVKPIVDIIVDGVVYASRQWTIIPRVGEAHCSKRRRTVGNDNTDSMG